MLKNLYDTYNQNNKNNTRQKALETHEYRKNPIYSIAQPSQIIEFAFSNLITIKAFSSEEKTANILKQKRDEFEEFKKNNPGFKNPSVYYDDTMISFENPIVFIKHMAEFIIPNFINIMEIYLIGSKILTGELTYGDLTTYQTMQCDYVLSSYMSCYFEIKGKIERSLKLYEIYSYKGKIQANIGKSKENYEGTVEFKNVSFAYPSSPETQVLNDISFKIKGGTRVGVVGPSGGGKTTLAFLLLRLYDPNSGDIFLDQENYKDFNINSVHRKIGFVSQETRLLPGTLLENITYGVDEYTQEKLEKVLKMSRVDEILEKGNFKEKGLETVITLNQIFSISGGQKQRIAIARCLMKDCNILIFDEATSALDGENEYQIQKAIDEIVVNCNITTFVIAHRLNTIKNSDVILVIDNGRLVENGSHRELMKKENGFYRQLINRHLESVTTLENNDKNNMEDK